MCYWMLKDLKIPVAYEHQDNINCVRQAKPGRRGYVVTR